MTFFSLLRSSGLAGLFSPSCAPAPSPVPAAASAEVQEHRSLPLSPPEAAVLSASAEAEECARSVPGIREKPEPSYLGSSVWKHVRSRIFWIASMAGLEIVSGLIIHSHEEALSSLIILAFYMPMIADTGGNTGSQTSAVIIRAVALGEVGLRDILRVLFKEIRIALLLGAFLALLALGKVLFLSGSEVLPEGMSLVRVGWVIGIALGIQVVCSNIIGALLPLAALKLKLDPAVLSGPLLTTIVDITGLLIYFGTARMLLGV